ncbi:hypothetical protein FHX44_11881 [Pseudonocardia hierapolitana]|uniref:Isochorismatase family protein n=1 Tax=Pseudonocardia hierapolitana TaxID=1128676 RepID=A0A561SJD9_9PSEU|nr:hypothetical protein FHX44_11881 [Pseudonocardia hierapolitana]
MLTRHLNSAKATGRKKLIIAGLRTEICPTPTTSTRA